MTIAPINSPSLSMGTAIYDRAPPSLAAGFEEYSDETSVRCTTSLVLTSRAKVPPADGWKAPRCLSHSARAGGTPTCAMYRKPLLSHRKICPKLALQMRTEFCSIV